jgi:uncharacterized membrane protein
VSEEEKQEIFFGTKSSSCSSCSCGIVAQLLGFDLLGFGLLGFCLLAALILLLLLQKRAGLRCWPPSAESFSNLPGL